jgi:N-acyl-D-aspartate/D-glutamate deacylase
MLDLKIQGGQIVDGSGAPRRRGDIGVRDGRIVALGGVTEPARETLDAAGQVVAPGFIDIHTHYDAQAFWDPTLSPSCYHGVTTVLGGFCGFSIAPLRPESSAYLMHMLARVEGMPLHSLAAGVPWDWTSFGDFLNRLEGRLAINAGFLAGHSAIRRHVMGARAVGPAATPGEIEQMKSLLRQCIREGAIGFSSSLSVTHSDGDGNPVPSRHATREELIALYSVVGEFEGTIAEIAPPSLDFSDETREILTTVSLAAQRPVNWNLINVDTLSGEEQHRTTGQLQAGEHAQRRGARVVGLTVPQAARIRINLANGVIFDTIPGWAEFLRRPIAERMNLLRDPAERARLKASAATMTGILALAADWPALKIVEVFSQANRAYLNRLVGDIAAEQSRDPFEVFVEVVLADRLRTSFIPRYREDSGEAGAAVFEARARLWKHPDVLIGGSDAGAHLDMIDTFGVSTALLSEGVRQHAVITLEDAVRQITQRPAELMGLRDRGVLRPGAWADIVVFDPEAIGAGPTYTREDLPGGGARLYSDARGIAHVIVNGREVIRNGVYLKAPAGAVLRSGVHTETVPIPAHHHRIKDAGLA